MYLTQFPIQDFFLLAVIPSLMGPLQALMALLPQILLALAAFFTAIFSVQSWRLRAQAASQKAAKNKLVVSIVALVIVAIGFGGWWLYKQGQQSALMVQPKQTATPTNPGVSPANPLAVSPSPNDPPPVAPGPQLPSPKVAWKITGQLTDFSPSPTVRGDFVYLGGGQGSAFTGTSGFVACVKASDGTEIWRFPTPRHVFSSPAVADGSVLFGEGLHTDRETNLYCLDEKNGQLRWKFTIPSHLESSPLIANGRVYFGGGDAGVYCVNLADGTEIWHRRGWHVDTRGALADGKLIVGTGYDPLTVACLEAATGKILWEYTPEVSAWGEPRIVGSQVIIGIGNGTYSGPAASPEGSLLALNLSDGKELWRVRLSDAIFGAPAIEGDRAYFGCRDGHVYAVDLGKGTIVWKQRIGSPVLCSPRYYNGSIVFGANDGQIRALRATDGTPLWQFNAKIFGGFGCRIISTPALADGKLYVGLSPGAFLALTEFSFN